MLSHSISGLLLHLKFVHSLKSFYFEAKSNSARENEGNNVMTENTELFFQVSL